MPSYHTYTDAQLIELLKSGNENAFAEIYERYWQKLFVVANNRLGSHMEAEEVVQDVFFSFWKRREALNIEYSLNTYFAVAVKYKVINYQASAYRKNVHEISGDVLSAEPATEMTLQLLTAKELQEQLTKAIDNLPEKCRIVFLKSREDGKANAVIANELNISEKTVEAHITRALHALRSSLRISIPLMLELLSRK
ncbi:MAG TPA: RNA polymerase sigma-70 factor [Arachidicoccus sp.]